MAATGLKLTTMSNMQSAEDWPSSALTNAPAPTNDTTNFVAGSQSISFATNSASIAQVKNTISATAKSGVGVWVFVTAADLANLGIIRLRIFTATSPTTSRYYQGTVWQDSPDRSERLIADQWNYIWVSFYNFAYSGFGELWVTDYDISSIMVEVSRNGATDTAVSIGGIVTDDSSVGGLTIHFDDAKEGVYTYGYPMLKALGWKACIGVNSATIGTDGKMSWAQLQEVHAAGWDIMNHTENHEIISTLTHAEVIAEIVDCQQELFTQNLNRGVDILVWPGNNGIPSTPTDWLGIEVASPYATMTRGSSIGRGTDIARKNLESSGTTWLHPDWQQLPFFALYDTTGSQVFADKYEAAMDAIVARKEMLILYTHDIYDTFASQSVDVSVQMFSDMLAWAEAKETAGELQIITTTEWKKEAGRVSGLAGDSLAAVNNNEQYEGNINSQYGKSNKQYGPE